MGIQINGQTDRISAVDGSFGIQDLAELNISGIVTAASANFTGNVSVGGTLTYQDVTNIDSVGVITARAGVDVNNGHIVLDSGYSLQWSDSHERIEQSDGKLEFFTNNTEKVTISGSSLGINRTNPVAPITARRTDAGGTGTNGVIAEFANSSGYGVWFGQSSASGASWGATTGDFYWNTGGLSSPVERLRIASDGQVTFDKGAPSGANQVIARFQAESSRRLDIVWHDSGSLLGFDLPGSHSYIFKCAGSERLRITSDGKMGVGTGSPNHRLTLHQSGTSTFDALNITSGLTNSVGLQFGIDSSSNVFFWHTANGAIKFATNNVERVRVTNGGLDPSTDGVTDLGNSSKRFRDLYLSSGIFLGGTTSSNELEDYEEGSWTPTYLSGLNSASYSNTTGTYTKIGNLVTFTLRIQATGTNVGSHARITGLPFTSSTDKDEGSATFGYVGNLPGNQEVDIYLHIPGNSININFYYTSGAQFYGNGGNGLDGKTLHIRGFYYT